MYFTVKTLVAPFLVTDCDFFNRMDTDPVKVLLADGKLPVLLEQKVIVLEDVELEHSPEVE